MMFSIRSERRRSRGGLPGAPTVVTERTTSLGQQGVSSTSSEEKRDLTSPLRSASRPCPPHSSGASTHAATIARATATLLVAAGVHTYGVFLELQPSLFSGSLIVDSLAPSKELERRPEPDVPSNFVTGRDSRVVVELMHISRVKVAVICHRHRSHSIHKQSCPTGEVVLLRVDCDSLPGSNRVVLTEGTRSRHFTHVSRTRCRTLAGVLFRHIPEGAMVTTAILKCF